MTANPNLLTPVPNSAELEGAILGGILSDTNAIATALQVFGDANPFYLETPRKVYSACVQMYNTFRPIDLLTVSEELRKRGELEKVGGSYQLVEYTNRIASTANLEYHCRIIFQMFLQREIIRTSQELISKAQDPTTDALELLESAESALWQFTSNLVQPQHKDAGTITRAVLQKTEAIRTGQATPGIPTGFAGIDDKLGGLVPGEVYVIAARPGMGKTAFVMSVARKVAKSGRKVGVFSMEMSSEQLVQRLISQACGVPLGIVQNPKQASQQDYSSIQAGAAQIAELPIVIDDDGGYSISKMRGKARAMRREGVEVLVVDYIQLMSGSDKKGGNREQEISEISRGLKALAKELRIPILALSQLSRAVETRGGEKKPILADLRESGSIEQDAYSVIFLYRPEYYRIEENAEGESMKGIAEVIIAKNRNGALGSVLMRFYGAITAFADFETIFDNEPTPF